MTPGAMATFDLLVLGGGSAGFAAAIKGADLGARVAIVEGGTLGGTCVNVGCIPSKTLLRAAEANHRRTHHPFEGVPNTDGRVDWHRVREQKDDLVKTLRREKYENVLASYESVSLIRQRAQLVSDRVLQLEDGRQVTGEKIVLATGSTPWVPPLAGLSEARWLDNATAMALERLPESLAVIGAGAVGLELAQMFRRLGVSVTVLEALPHVLPSEDPSLGETLVNYLRTEGLTILTEAQVQRIAASGGGGGHDIAFRTAGREQSVTVDELLIATGRRPSTAGLGLARAGIAVGARGEIIVNEFLQTTKPAVYAAGDVIGDPMFVYVAAYAGTVAAENALSGNGRTYDLTAVPSVTFTDPAVASVGLTEAAARQRRLIPVVAELSLEHVPRARAAHDTRGFIRLVADQETKRILGAQIIAGEAGELIAEAGLVVRAGLTIDQITAAFHPYLTLAEGLKLAAQTFTTDVSKLSCCAT